MRVAVTTRAARLRARRGDAGAAGKIKVAQVVAILALILAHGQWWPFYWIGQVALWMVVVTALVSGADYFRRFNEVVGLR